MPTKITNNVTSEYTPDRIKQLRLDLRLTQVEFGKELGVGREWIARLEKGDGEVSELVEIKLKDLEARAASQLGQRVGEAPAQYQTQSQSQRSLLLNPTHSLPVPEPSDQQLMDYFLRSLSVARTVPGGRGYFYLQMKKHLNPDDIAKLRD